MNRRRSFHSAFLPCLATLMLLLPGAPALSVSLKQTTLPSGRKISVISTIEEVRADGKVASLKYVSAAITKGPDALATEMDDVWDQFRVDADRSRANKAVILACLDAASEKAAASCTFERDGKGAWHCTNNPKIGIETPAKAAYKEGIKNLLAGRTQQALAAYNRAAALDPSYAQTYVDRGACYLLLGKYPESIADSNTALKLNPESAKAFCNRGLARCKQKQWRDAVEDFNSSLRFEPKMVLAYENRAAALIELGRLEYAIRDLSIAIKLQANPARAYKLRSVALQKLAESDAKMSQQLGFNPAKQPL